MGKLTIRRRGYALGAEVTGVDTSKPVDESVVEEIRQALRDHIVLCFPGQDLDAFQLRSFGRLFGEPDAFNTNQQKNLDPDVPEVVVRGNIPFELKGKTAPVSATVDQWHTDYSQSIRPATFTFLHAKDLPDVGGDTMFANTTMAYDTLSPAYQRMIDPLNAVHDVAYGSTYLQSTPEFRAAHRKRNPPRCHPIARAHPETGRKALFTGERVVGFEGMTEEESRPILRYLLEHATRYEFLYRHRWVLGDLLVWDNACSLHYALADYDTTQLRRHIRISLVGPEMGHPLAEDASEASLVTAAS